jgi:uncharacterized protein involved in outer membrane biogenesis
VRLADAQFVAAKAALQQAADHGGRHVAAPEEGRGHAGSFAKLRDASEPYPVELELRFGETEATVEGTIDRPLDVAGLDIEWSLEGPSLDDVFQLTGVPLPPTPSYSLTGSLFHGEQLWRVSDLDGRLGDSDLGGTMEVDVGTDPLTFEADLVSDRLDIKDLGGFLGAPVEEDAEETEGLIPERELDLTRLNAANGHARLEAKSIIAPDLPLDDFTAELELQDGTLRLQPASFGVAQGTVDLWLSLYGSEPPVRTDILARVRGLHLKEAFRGSEFVQETGGEIDGRVELHGRGNSLQEILGSADGHSFLVMTGGKMSAMILELIGLDAAEALGLYFGDNGDTPVEIRCAATEFEVDGGIAEVKLGVLDWELSTLGSPLADLAYNCMPYRLAPSTLGGVLGADLAALGLPTEADYVAAYCRRTGRSGIPDWEFYLAFAMFRLAAIAQGIMGRVIAGTANDPNARSRGERARPLAEAGWAPISQGRGSQGSG